MTDSVFHRTCCVCGRWTLHQEQRILRVEGKWTHWGLNPGLSACEADVIPLHHVPNERINRKTNSHISFFEPTQRPGASDLAAPALGRISANNFISVCWLAVACPMTKTIRHQANSFCLAGSLHSSVWAFRTVQISRDSRSQGMNPVDTKSPNHFFTGSLRGLPCLVHYHNSSA